MNRKDLLEATALFDLARSLSQIERQIIQALRTKGPGLPIEIAVRVLSLPDEVRQPLADLQDRRLIQTESFTAGTFGNQVLSLSEEGEHIADLLNDPATLVAPASWAKTADPALGAAEVLKSLGDLAVSQGKADEARQMYEQALQIYRDRTLKDG